MKHQLQKGLFILIIMSLFRAQITMAVPKLIPVVNGELAVGQWYFEGSKSSLGGNAAINIIPAIRYTNRFTVIPTFSSFYRGTRSAEELAGGNTLFQDSWENGVNLKFVHGLSERFKLRENVGARMKWYRETRDENWNKGLYDYDVLNAGVEGEYSFAKKTSVALGYDLSLLAFPNYVSLESNQSSDMSREYAAKRPLDQVIHLVSLRASLPITQCLSAGFQGFYSPRNYQSQTVVTSAGVLSSQKRNDTFIGGTTSLERPFRISASARFVPSVFYGYSTLNSNQNHYDASVTKFIPDFYDYNQQRAGTQISFIFGKSEVGPMTVDASYVYSSRDYRSRVIQSDAGVYLDEKLYITYTEINLGFSYPLTKNFRLKTTTSFGRSKSNNQFEQFYRYNYSDANYQFGVSYEY